MSPVSGYTPCASDLKAQDLAEADKHLMEAERICRYWNFHGSELALAKLRTRLRLARKRAEEKIGA